MIHDFVDVLFIWKIIFFCQELNRRYDSEAKAWTTMNSQKSALVAFVVETPFDTFISFVVPMMVMRGIFTGVRFIPHYPLLIVAFLRDYYIMMILIFVVH